MTSQRHHHLLELIDAYGAAAVFVENLESLSKLVLEITLRATPDDVDELLEVDLAVFCKISLRWCVGVRTTGNCIIYLSRFWHEFKQTLN